MKNEGCSNELIEHQEHYTFIQNNISFSSEIMDHAVLHKEHEKSYLEKELRAFLDVI